MNTNTATIDSQAFLRQLLTGRKNALINWVVFNFHALTAWKFLKTPTLEPPPTKDVPVQPKVDKMQQVFRVLSLDGGGIRGIIECLVLMAIERLTGEHIADLFDLLAGTSTGGLLALALVVRGEDGKPKFWAKDLLTMYLTQGPLIFLKHLLGEGKGLIFGGPLYPDRQIDEPLQERFGSVTMKEAYKPVMVIIVDRAAKIPRVLKSWHKEDADLLMWEVARGTSAAPTMFNPIGFELPSGQVISIDGGMIANNPSTAAFAEAQRLMREKGERYPILMVSVGCGFYLSEVTLAQVRHYRLLDWANELPNLFVSMSGPWGDYHMREFMADRQDLLPCELGQLYYRFDTGLLSHAHSSVDDASQSNMNALVDLGEKLVKENTKTLEELSRKLSYLHACERNSWLRTGSFTPDVARIA